MNPLRNLVAGSTELSKNFLQIAKPQKAMILSYYLKAFSGNFMFHLSLDRPVDLPSAKKKVNILDDSWKAAGRPNTSEYSREKPEPKSKEKTSTPNKGSDPMSIIIKEMQKLRIDMAQKNTSMQNIIIQLERAQQLSQPRLPPKNLNKGPP